MSTTVGDQGVNENSIGTLNVGEKLVIHTTGRSISGHHTGAKKPDTSMFTA